MTVTEPLPSVDAIPGWFSFREWYETLAAEAPEGAVLVELGVFCGKSLAFLAGAVRDKGCTVFGVDTFLGSPEFASGVKFSDPAANDLIGRWGQLPRGILALKAVQHLDAAGVLDDVTLIVSDSAKAARFFPPRSVWSVFVDAGHDADSVERDVRAWLPKVAPGGWIAGDDYSLSFPGVRNGLLRVFDESQLPPVPEMGMSTVWAMRVP